MCSAAAAAGWSSRSRYAIAARVAVVDRIVSATKRLRRAQPLAHDMHDERAGSMPRES